MSETSSVRVLKASGEYEPFSEEKVRSSLQRAAVDETLQNQIVNQIKDRLYEGISTKEIYDQIAELLEKEERSLASRYHLKQAIMELGPSGFPFEKFVAGILESNGYQATVNQIVQGRCVTHEVDVVAQKDNQQLMIECKFHNRSGAKTEIKDALYTYARFLDIAPQKEKFHQAWLATNTKVTTEVMTYAQCVGLQILSWNYPPEGSLRLLIETKGLHPVTCLKSLNEEEKKKLLEAGVVFCWDLVTREIDFLPSDLVKKAKSEAIKVCGRENQELQ